MTRLTRNRLALAACLAFALFALGLTAGSMASGQPPTSRLRALNSTEAIALLGATLPAPAYLPKGLHQVMLQAPPLEMAQLQIDETFATSGNVNAVQLSVIKSPNIQRIDPDAVAFDLSGTPAQVTVRVVGAPGAQWTFVSYTWSRGPLSYALLVHLLDGLTRTDADQIALSIK
jgi:hypothetical protein